jgi:acetyl-CoA acetyltransferase
VPLPGSSKRAQQSGEQRRTPFDDDPLGTGRTRNVPAPTNLAGQFEQPYGPMEPPTLFTIPVLRYMKTYGLTHEQLAMVSVVQREWAAKNPRAPSRRRSPSRMF